MNSKDLNMSTHLKELAEAGVCSFKIEGRMKSEYYLATVVNAYRRLLDGGEISLLGEELKCAAHRAYTTAYALGNNGDTIACDNSQTKGTCEFIAVVTDCRQGRVYAEMRGRFYEGDVLEILSPSEQFRKAFTVADLKDGAGNSCTDAKRVQDIYSFACSYPLQKGDILRRRKEPLA